MKKDFFELLHNGEVKFQGSEHDCRWKLLRTQPNSIQWATTKDGWEIRPCENPQESVSKTKNKK
jgi:hypothetical protein